MKNIYKTIGVFVALFVQFIVFGQSPYDSFEKEQKTRYNYRLPEVVFRAENEDTTDIIRYIELDIETLQLKYFSLNDSLLAEVQLEQEDVKFISRDPKFEKNFWVSPYNYCSNNPVNMIDPDGKDDFDAQGKLIKNPVFQSDNIYVYIEGQRTLISNVDADKYGSVLEKVANYYANEVGISSWSQVGISTYDGNEKNPLAFTKGNSISIIKKDGRINSALSNKYAMMSTLEQEKDHQVNKHGYTGYSPSDFEHAQVYGRQVNSDNFRNAPESYQRGILGTMGNLMESAVNSPRMTTTERSAQGLINSTNTNLRGTPFQMSGGNDWDNFRVRIHGR